MGCTPSVLDNKTIVPKKINNSNIIQETYSFLKIQNKFLKNELNNQQIQISKMVIENIDLENKYKLKIMKKNKINGKLWNSLIKIKYPIYSQKLYKK